MINPFNVVRNLYSTRIECILGFFKQTYRKATDFIFFNKMCPKHCRSSEKKFKDLVTTAKYQVCRSNDFWGIKFIAEKLW